ncbi:MAG: formylglycine-generating enzyme family protein [Herminiimonas sp.]|nr:formylglycine-generating enzyme family protein [Herminiimonas sp.]
MYRKYFLIWLTAACLVTSAFAGVLPKDSAEQFELTFWESIKDSRHPTDYEAYVQSYPKGRFVALARTRITRLRDNSTGTGSGSAASGTQASSGLTGSGGTTATPARAVPAEAAKGAMVSATPTVPVPPPPSRRTRAASHVAETANAQAGVAGAQSHTQVPPLPAPPLAEVRDCDICPALVALPRGGFTMGSNVDDPSERPAFHVSINSAFAIGKHEVTVEQWSACVANGGCPQTSTDTSRSPNTPARDINWDDARQYTVWLSKVTSKAYRLPSEAEWEYATRGNTTTRFWWGDQMTTGKANCKECGEPWQADAPAAVGSFAANPFGLFDMNGSVWEWVSDCWHDSYQRAPSDGRSWEEPDCQMRVLRGGSWRQGASYMPSSTRFKYDAGVRQSQNGFRVARNME